MTGYHRPSSGGVLLSNHHPWRRSGARARAGVPGEVTRQRQPSPTGGELRQRGRARAGPVDPDPPEPFATYADPFDMGGQGGLVGGSVGDRDLREQRSIGKPPPRPGLRRPVPTRHSATWHRHQLGPRLPSLHPRHRAPAPREPPQNRGNRPNRSPQAGAPPPSATTAATPTPNTTKEPGPTTAASGSSAGTVFPLQIPPDTSGDRGGPAPSGLNEARTTLTNHRPRPRSSSPGAFVRAAARAAHPATTG
jgi:hypothetical protein